MFGSGWKRGLGVVGPGRRGVGRREMVGRWSGRRECEVARVRDSCDVVGARCVRGGAGAGWLRGARKPGRAALGVHGGASGGIAARAPASIVAVDTVRLILARTALQLMLPRFPMPPLRARSNGSLCGRRCRICTSLRRAVFVVR